MTERTYTIVTVDGQIMNIKAVSLSEAMQIARDGQN